MTTIREQREREIRSVREALRAAGIYAVVRYGRGTASNWVDIFIGSGQQFGTHEKRDTPGERDLCTTECQLCATLKALEAETSRIAYETTGRSDKNVSIARSEPKGSKRPIIHTWQPSAEPDDPPPAARAQVVRLPPQLRLVGSRGQRRPERTAA